MTYERRPLAELFEKMQSRSPPAGTCETCSGEGQEQYLDANEPDGVGARTCASCGGSGAKPTIIRAQVEEFHKAFEQDVGARPKAPDSTIVRLRARLIAEEFCEMLEALFGAVPDVFREKLANIVEGGPLNRIDLVKLADALADIDYVVEGTRLAFGINGAPVALEVHRSNMAKLGPDGKPIVRADGKRLKPPGWTPPNIAGELRRQGWDGT